VLFSTLLLVSADFGGTANVYIPPHQEFVLGEFEDSSFTAKLINKGKQEVKIRIVTKESEEQTQELVLDSGGETKVSVSKNEKVFLINKSSTEAHLKVKLNKGVEGMRYQNVE
jgi:hypothetical protein